MLWVRLIFYKCKNGYSRDINVLKGIKKSNNLVTNRDRTCCQSSNPESKQKQNTMN